MDTGGQETFNSQNKTYYKKADCILLVYDITSIKSFNADLKEKREVTQEMGSNLAIKNGFIFMETSCEDNYNVSDAFETLIEMTNTDMIKKGNINKKPSKLSKSLTKKKKSFC